MPVTNRPVPLICLLVALTGLLWLSERDFSSRGEGREVLAAQSVLDGNVILPRGYGGIAASKPPLLHWCIALFSLPHGKVTPFTARFPSALSSCIFLITFYLFLQRWSGRRLATLSMLLLYSSVEWFRLSVDARVDMLHSVFVAGSFLAIFSWAGRKLAGIPVVLILLMVGATLAKGPVGIVLPCIVLAVHSAVEGRRRKEIGAALLKAAVPSAVLSGIWYIAAILEGGSEFLDRVNYENIARFTSSMEDKPHSHTVIYLALTLFIGILPWILPFLPGLLQKYASPFAVSLYRSMRSTPASFRWLSVRLRVKRKIVLVGERFRDWFRSHAALERFSWICFACVFIFYSIPSGKRSVYLLPAYPFIAFLAAQYILTLGILSRRLAAKSFSWLCVFLIAVCLAVIFIGAKGSLLTPVLKSKGSLFTVEQLQILMSSDAVMVAVLFLPMLFAVMHLGARFFGASTSFLGGIFALTFSVYLSAHAVLIPQFAKGISPKNFAAQISPLVAGEDEVYSFGNEFYGVSFYLGRRMTTLQTGFQPGMYVVLYESKLQNLEAALGPGRIKIRHRSAHGVMRPLEKAVLVQIVEAENA